MMRSDSIYDGDAPPPSPGGADDDVDIEDDGEAAYEMAAYEAAASAPQSQAPQETLPKLTAEDHHHGSLPGPVPSGPRRDPYGPGSFASSSKSSAPDGDNSAGASATGNGADASGGGRFQGLRQRAAAVSANVRERAPVAAASVRARAAILSEDVRESAAKSSANFRERAPVVAAGMKERASAAAQRARAAGSANGGGDGDATTGDQGGASGGSSKPTKTPAELRLEELRRRARRMDVLVERVRKNTERSLIRMAEQAARDELREREMALSLTEEEGGSSAATPNTTGRKRFGFRRGPPRRPSNDAALATSSSSSSHGASTSTAFFQALIVPVGPRDKSEMVESVRRMVEIVLEDERERAEAEADAAAAAADAEADDGEDKENGGDESAAGEEGEGEEEEAAVATDDVPLDEPPPAPPSTPPPPPTPSAFDVFTELNVLSLAASILTGRAFRPGGVGSGEGEGSAGSGSGSIGNVSSHGVGGERRLMSPRVGGGAAGALGSQSLHGSSAHGPSSGARDARAADLFAKAILLPPPPVADAVLNALSRLLQCATLSSPDAPASLAILANDDLRSLIDLPLELYLVAKPLSRNRLQDTALGRRMQKKGSGGGGDGGDGGDGGGGGLEEGMKEQLLSGFVGFLKSMSGRMRPETTQFYLVYPEEEEQEDGDDDDKSENEAESEEEEDASKKSPPSSPSKGRKKYGVSVRSPKRDEKEDEAAQNEKEGEENEAENEGSSRALAVIEDGPDAAAGGGPIKPPVVAAPPEPKEEEEAAADDADADAVPVLSPTMSSAAAAVRDIEFPLYARALQLLSLDHSDLVRLSAVSICLDIVGLVASDESDLWKVAGEEESFRQRREVAKYVCSPARAHCLAASSVTRLTNLRDSIEESARKADAVSLRMRRARDRGLRDAGNGSPVRPRLSFSVNDGFGGSFKGITSGGGMGMVGTMGTTAGGGGSGAWNAAPNLDDLEPLEPGSPLRSQQRSAMAKSPSPEEEARGLREELRESLRNVEAELQLLGGILQAGLTSLNEQVVENFLSTYVRALLRPLSALSLGGRSNLPLLLTALRRDRSGGSGSRKGGSGKGNKKLDAESFVDRVCYALLPAVEKDHGVGGYGDDAAEDPAEADDDTASAKASLICLAAVFHNVPNGPLRNLTFAALFHPAGLPDRPEMDAVESALEVFEESATQDEEEEEAKPRTDGTADPVCYSFGRGQSSEDGKDAGGGRGGARRRMSGGMGGGEERVAFAFSRALADALEGGSGSSGAEAEEEKENTDSSSPNNRARDALAACLAGDKHASGEDGAGRAKVSALSPFAVAMAEAALGAVPSDVADAIALGKDVRSIVDAEEKEDGGGVAAAGTAVPDQSAGGQSSLMSADDASASSGGGGSLSGYSDASSGAPLSVLTEDDDSSACSSLTRGSDGNPRGLSSVKSLKHKMKMKKESLKKEMSMKKDTLKMSMKKDTLKRGISIKKDMPSTKKSMSILKGRKGKA